MDWIYLSPHFDDAALSCGGLIWEQARAGERVSVWTVCAGEPGQDLSDFAQFKHNNWNTGAEAAAQRKAEDELSCSVLGADTKYYPIPDCIYRQDPENGDYLYDSEESLWEPLHPAEDYLLEQLREYLKRDVPENAQLVSPLALGDHVDHRLTRAAAEALERPLWYYADYPYVLECDHQMAQMRRTGWISAALPVSDQGLSAWQKAVAAHASQLSTFWANRAHMESALRDYRQRQGGAFLWKSPPG